MGARREWRLKEKCAALMVVLLSGTAAIAESAPGKTSARRLEGGKPSRDMVRMDAVEVQGIRERPQRLHLPAPELPVASAPLPLELFREDLARPPARSKATGTKTATEGSHD